MGTWDKIRESQLDDQQKKEIRKAKRFTNTIDEKSNSSPAEGYGLCSSCKNMDYREFEHGHQTFALCGSYIQGCGRRLSNVHRITKCSEYERKGMLEIETMWAIATIINVNPKKVVGFVRENDVEILPSGSISISEDEIEELEYEEDF